jgi:hypothetical protein
MLTLHWNHAATLVLEYCAYRYEKRWGAKDRRVPIVLLLSLLMLHAILYLFGMGLLDRGIGAYYSSWVWGVIVALLLLFMRARYSSQRVPNAGVVAAKGGHIL